MKDSCQLIYQTLIMQICTYKQECLCCDLVIICNSKLMTCDLWRGNQYMSINNGLVDNFNVHKVETIACALTFSHSSLSAITVLACPCIEDENSPGQVLHRVEFATTLQPLMYAVCQPVILGSSRTPDPSPQHLHVGVNVKPGVKHFRWGQVHCRWKNKTKQNEGERTFTHFTNTLRH